MCFKDGNLGAANDQLLCSISIDQIKKRNKQNKLREKLRNLK